MRYWKIETTDEQTKIAEIKVFEDGHWEILTQNKVLLLSELVKLYEIANTMWANKYTRLEAVLGNE